MSTKENDGKMGVASIALFSMTAVIILDTLTASASIGVSSITWWLITLVVFVIPYGLITSELATTYPGEGGIYDWVKSAFGYKWAVRTTWYYWLNVGLWCPSVYILFAGMFSELFMPGLGIFGILTICVLLTVITVVICNVSVDLSVIISNVTAVIKVFIILVLGVGGFNYAMTNGIANEFTFEAMIPSLDGGIAFLPALVFNLIGFELVGTMTADMKDVRDTPKATFIAIAITAFLYIFGTLGILAAMPVDSISLVAGITDTLKVLFGTGQFGTFMLYAIGTLTLMTFFGNMIVWVMGASRAASESAKEGELPEILGLESKKYKTPIGANNVTGVLSLIVIFTYAIISQDSDELFWSIFAFSSCIFLLPYLFMFPAYLKLRLSDGNKTRPFKVPGGITAQYAMSIICFLTIVQAIILFIFPEMIVFSIDWTYTGPVLTGVIICVIAGELVLLNAIKKRKHSELEEQIN